MKLSALIHSGLRISLIVIAIFSIAGTGLAWAQSEPPRLTGDALVFGGSRNVEMQVVKSSFTGIELAAQVGALQVAETKLLDTHYLTLSGAGLGRGATIGLPDLPVLRRDVEIPYAAQYSLELVSSQYTEVKLADLGLPGQILPLQPSQPKCGGPVEPCQPDAAVYQQDAYFPASPLALGGEYEVRGHRALTVEVWPVAYNPVQGTLRLYSDVSFRIRLEGSDAIQTLSQSARLASPAFEETLSQTLLNYNLNQGARGLQELKSVHYLIITADAYESGLADFVALKLSQGFSVTVAKTSVIGSTTTAIKNYITTQYQGANPPSYVLLVGDHNDGADSIPAWSFPGYTGKYTDLYYVTMNGTGDYVPDIFRGRFPVRDTAQLANMVNNNLWYENNVTGAEPWVKKIAYLASDDSGYYDVTEATHNYCIETYTQPLGYSGTFPNNPQAGGDKLYAITYSASNANVISSLNDGRAITIYSGHGSSTGWAGPSLSQTNVRNLTGNLIPYVAGHACVTADYSTLEAFSDTWVIQNGKGALVYLGASNNSYWNEDDTLQRTMFDTFYDPAPGDPSVAQAMYAGLAGVQSAYPGSAQYYWEEYNLFGDPSLVIVTGPRISDFTVDAEPEQAGICSAGTATSTISLGSLLGFASPVALSLNGAPAGITPAFVPASLTPPGDAQLTLTNNGTAAVGSYALDVVGTSGAMVHTTTLDLDIFTALPGAPLLQSPPDEAQNQAAVPTLSWQAPAQVSTYHLQVATDADFTDLVVDESALTSTSYELTASLQPCTRYYWRVTALNTCGAGASSSIFSFTVAPVPGECCNGYITETLHFTDLESGWNGWSDASTESTIWDQTTVAAYSPTHALLGRDVAYTSDQRLLSPALALPPGEQPLYFSFWQMHYFEGTAPASCWDGGLLEISGDGGASWTQLTPLNGTYGYNGLVSVSYSNPLGGLPAWCGDMTTWQRTAVDLSAYAGQEVQVRLRLGTDNSVADTGWYVDDLRVQTCVPANQPPVAEAQSVSTLVNQSRPITLAASDADEDALTWEIVDPPNHGGLSGTAPELTYTPDTDYTGADSFTFKVNDGTVDSNTAQVSITVLPANEPPVANLLDVNTLEDLPVDFSLTADDLYPGTLTWSVLSLPGHGTLSGAAPALTYTPGLDFYGADSFTFQVNDGEFDSNIATVTISVASVNDDPLASTIQDVEWLARQAHTYLIPAFTDVDDGDVLTYSATANGLALPAWLVIDPNSGEFSGVPDNDHAGIYLIEVVGQDGHGGMASATFTLTVQMNPYILTLPIITR